MTESQVSLLQFSLEGILLQTQETSASIDKAETLLSRATGDLVEACNALDRINKFIDDLLEAVPEINPKNKRDPNSPLL